jgi:TonB family protein
VTRALAVLLLISAAACIDRIGGRRLADGVAPGAVRPDVPPEMLNEEPPFRYPPALWVQRVQGNVTLRIYVDAEGLPVPDSTVVAESSGIPALDSAAIAGVRDLRFRPARLRDVPVGISLMLPVFFRHPDAPPLPGDTALAPIGRVPPPAE